MQRALSQNPDSGWGLLAARSKTLVAWVIIKPAVAQEWLPSVHRQAPQTSAVQHANPGEALACACARYCTALELAPCRACCPSSRLPLALAWTR